MEELALLPEGKLSSKDHTLYSTLYNRSGVPGSGYGHLRAVRSKQKQQYTIQAVNKDLISITAKEREKRKRETKSCPLDVGIGLVL